MSALRALYVAHEEIDPNELIDDILAVAAQTVSLVIRASHDVDLCRGCMANTVYGYSVEVAAQLAADAAAQEPDEPPFSGSIN
ncbi:hypothetical protein [Hoeflea sp.]|uniref:hypothetical protein n=1 Tax=Hoeflea sp. TaxID=1940281 RepID=UPI003B518B6E